MKIEKKCKPNYRMGYFDNEGCQSIYIFKFGACQKCFIKWARTTKEGKEWHKKQTRYKMKEKEKEKRIEKKKVDRDMRIQLMSTSDYWSNVFQPKINSIIRTIDKGCGCICNHTTLGKMNAGHFYSVGSNKTLSLNLHNIFLQSVQSNGWRGGEPLEFLSGLERVYGTNYKNFVLSLKKCPALHMTKLELIERYDAILKLNLKHKKEGYLQLSAQKRISLRNEINATLNIYPKEYSIYDPEKKY